MEFKALGNVLTLSSNGSLTSNSVNVFQATFDFNPSWDGMARTAVFRTALHSVSVLLGTEATCTVPHEVLDAGFDMSVAVFGVLDGTTVLATNYVNTGPVLHGADTEAPEGAAPTPSQYEQLLAEINKVRCELGDIVAAGGFVTQDILSAAMDTLLQAALSQCDPEGSAKAAFNAAVEAAAKDATTKANAAAEAAKKASRPANWTPTYEEVGADKKGSAAEALKAAKEASIPIAEKGAADGVAPLDANKDLPLSALTRGAEIVESTTNVQVPVSAWLDNTVEGQPPFKAQLSIKAAANVLLSDPTPEVIFSVADASGGVFSLACEYATSTGVTIYAFDKPAATTIIPLVRLRRCAL